MNGAAGEAAMNTPERSSVAVVGASANRAKFGNRAVRAYRSEGWDVYPVHLTASAIEGLRAYRSVLDIPVALDRVSVYLQPRITLAVLDEIARKGTRELFLNPGSEDAAVLARAEALGLRPIQACSIVDIGRTPNDVD
jgi:predicted CoA-binding protein